MKTAVYLDHNATTPVHPDLLARIPTWLEAWGNPSSIHWAGRAPKAILRETRQNLAAFLGVDALELVFTSGGSEANNLALKGICDEASLKSRDQIIISSVEHPSVQKTAAFLKTKGYRLDIIPVNLEGQLDLAALQGMLSERTALVSVMLANNETGHLLPVREVANMAHAVGALMHCDAVQGLGKVPLNLRELGVDLASISAHKFYAFKGAGALYVRRGVNVTSLIHGGGQERGRRAGTENLLALASLGFMCGKGADIAANGERMAQLRDHFEAQVLQKIEHVKVTGPVKARLPNTSSMVIAGVDGETLLMNLDVRGFAVSTGAACSSGSPEPSPVLLAMGLTRSEAQSSLRVSFGWETTPEEIEAFVEALEAVVRRLRTFKHGEKFAYGI